MICAHVIMSQLTKASLANCRYGCFRSVILMGAWLLWRCNPPCCCSIVLPADSVDFLLCFCRRGKLVCRCANLSIKISKQQYANDKCATRVLRLTDGLLFLSNLLKLCMHVLIFCKLPEPTIAS